MSIEKDNVILILGNKGMLGHVVEIYLKEKGYNVHGINRADLDFRDFTKLEQLIITLNPDYIINCSGILITGKNIQEFGQINVALPHLLNHICERDNRKFIHISTNCVFNDIGPHKPKDKPDSTNWYGQSKAFGEIKGSNGITIRTSIIGPELKEDGSGLMHWFINKSPNETNGFTNALWNGVITLELAKFIKHLIDNFIKYTNNILNFHTSNTINKADLLEIINNEYNLGKKIIKTKRDGVHVSLLDGISTEKSYEEQIRELKEWY